MTPARYGRISDITLDACYIFAIIGSVCGVFGRDIWAGAVLIIAILAALVSIGAALHS